MERVRLIHHSWICSKNGLNTVVNYLLESKDIFYQNDLELVQLTYDDLYPRNFNRAKEDAMKYRLRTSIRKLFTFLSKYHAFFAWYLLYRSQIEQSEEIVDKYLEMVPDEKEIVFFHSIFPCYSYLKKRIRKQRVVLVLHTNGDNFDWLRIAYPKITTSKYYRRFAIMNDLVLSNVDRICLVSEKSMKTFLELYPEVDKNRVSFIYNGIADTRVLQREKMSDPIKISCVGSIIKRKGQHLLVDSMIKMKKGNTPNVHFTIVGDGPMREELENKVIRNDISQYFTFAGEQNDVTEILADSNIFMLPSFNEGLPIAIIEAMRASLPVVSTDVGGVKEMVEDGVNGIIIKPEVDSICDFLKRISSYDWLKMGVNARKTFEDKFSGRKMLDSYIRLLSF